MNETRFPSRTADKLMLRFPDGMRPQLKARAALNRRSMNAEIICLLERALDGETAAGASPEKANPAACNTAALQGSDIINHGY